MKYLSLKKLFHMNENKANKTYENRINSESAHLFEFKINNMPCFYIINDEMVNLIGQIYDINNEIEAKLNNNLPKLAMEQLVNSSLLEEIISSNKIEGIKSTRKELTSIIDNPSTKYRRFDGMVNSYNMIVNGNTNEITTPSQIRELYDRILLNDILNEDINNKPDGVLFRKENVEITNGSRCLHQGIIGEKNIMEAIEEALDILNDSNIHFLIRTSLFHYLFEYIHPFYDGNGRMGRFIVSLYLSKHLNTLCALQFSLSCLHKQNNYYKAFEETNDIRNKSDLTIFIIRFLEIYLSGLEELKDHVDDVSEDYHYLMKKIKTRVDDKYRTLMNILLQSTLFYNGGLTMNQLTTIIKSSKPTLRTKIKEVNDIYHCIVVDKESKIYRYSLDLSKIERW